MKRTFSTFDSFGPLKDIAVIRDKHTGLHRGCAFVTYWSGADADRARNSTTCSLSGRQEASTGEPWNHQVRLHGTLICFCIVSPCLTNISFLLCQYRKINFSSECFLARREANPRAFALVRFEVYMIRTPMVLASVRLSEIRKARSSCRSDRESQQQPSDGRLRPASNCQVCG
jgi:RNA recognition motif-containing protein